MRKHIQILACGTMYLSAFLPNFSYAAETNVKPNVYRKKCCKARQHARKLAPIVGAWTFEYHTTPDLSSTKLFGHMTFHSDGILTVVDTISLTQNNDLFPFRFLGSPDTGEWRLRKGTTNTYDVYFIGVAVSLPTGDTLGRVKFTGSLVLSQDRQFFTMNLQGALYDKDDLCQTVPLAPIIIDTITACRAKF